MMKVFAISNLAIPFVCNNSWYYSSLGDPNYPPDEVSFYGLPLIEDKVLPNSFGTGSLKAQLRIYKPNYISNKRIDILMDWYSNVND